MSRLDRVNGALAVYRGRDEQRYSIDTWLSNYLLPAMGQFTYGNVAYQYGGSAAQNMAISGNRVVEIANTLPGYLNALKQSPPAFAAQLVRTLVLSQARFTFRNPPWWHSTPRRKFGTPALQILAEPWPKATTGDLTSRMEWHAGLAGNSFVYRQQSRLRVLRPDWTYVLWGSQDDPEEFATGALDGELVGYIYRNQGSGKPQTLLADDVVHWCPLPDPEFTALGMSWLTPAIRQLQGDRQATEHTIRYFENGATPNLVVKGIPAMNGPQFRELVEAMEEDHSGVTNAYRTLYLTAGADATVVGANLKDLDLQGLHDGYETRLSMLSRVPAALLGIYAGLQGSTLNTGNFGMARRIFGDTWVHPTLQDLAGSLGSIIDMPLGAEMWFDTADIPILREDAKDAAEIEQVRASTINAYVREGFTPESAIAAVIGQDVTLLKHTGLVSVQLQPPGTPAPAAVPALPAGTGTGQQSAPAGRSASNGSR